MFTRSLLAATALAMVAACATSAGESQSAAPHIESTTRVAPGGLYEIVFNPADGDIYVAAIGPRGANSAAVVRLDGETLAPVASIDVSANPLFGLGINTRTQTLYGTDTRGGAVSAIDLRTGAVTATIRQGDAHPHLREVIVDEAANRVYASVVGFSREGQAPVPSQIWVINGATNALERVIDVDTSGLTGIQLDAANNRIFGTGMNSHDVVAVDLTSGRVTARWPTETEGPTNLAFDASGQRLFVASQQTGGLTVLNSQTGAIVAQTPTGEGALSVAYNPERNEIYLANRRAGTTTIISGADYGVIANLDSGTFPQTIAIDRASGRVYVTHKARGLPRDAAPGTPAPEDPRGDTVVLIRP